MDRECARTMLPAGTVRRSGIDLPGSTRCALTTWDGGGPTIVALHGLAHAGALWAGFAQAVAGRARMVVADLRGHGDSDRDASGRYALATLVADATAVLREVAPDGAVLVGHSLGGRIAAEIALQDLCPLVAAVLVDTPPNLPPAARHRLEQVVERPSRSATDIDEYVQWLSERHPFACAEHLRPLATALLKPATLAGWEEKFDPLVLDAWRAGRLSPPWPQRTGRTPVTLVRGVASAMLPRAVAAAMLDGGQVDEVIEVGRSGHDVPLDNPAALAEVVVEVAARSSRRR